MHDRQISLLCVAAATLWLAGLGAFIYARVALDSVGAAQWGLALCMFASTVSGAAIASTAVTRLTRDAFDLGRDTGRREAERGGVSSIR